jgi:hypothetical protein
VAVTRAQSSSRRPGGIRADAAWLVRTLRRRVRLRTRIRRAREAWREVYARPLPEWSGGPDHPGAPARPGAGGAADNDRAAGADGIPRVDARMANPQGRQRYGPRLPAGELLLTGDGGWQVARVPDGTVVVAGRAGHPLDDRQRSVLHQLGVVTVNAGRSGPRPTPHAATAPGSLLDRRAGVVVAQLAMTGVVLHLAGERTRTDGQSSGTPGEPAALPVSPELAEILTAPLPDGDDPMRWETRSVRQRREAMRRHAAGLVPPPVTAVLVSKRPHLAIGQVAALAAQTYPDLQIVVGLHGRPEPAALREAAGDRPVEVVTIDDGRNLGEALAEATDRAGGTIVTKVDDDDRYGPEHIWDLVLAHHFSGATVVGKGSEFVFVAPKDVTVRRRMGAEFFTDTVAGGTITLRRDDLSDAGGWPPVPRHVDRALLDRVVAAGAPVYRTHPIGFIYTRHGDGHTWDADLDHFLTDAQRRWRGVLAGEEFGPG